MLKAIAVLRTLFLLFILGSTFRAMPWWSTMPRTLDEQYSRCASHLDLVVRAVWLAIGWIFLETIVGWWLATRRPKATQMAAAPPSAPPPPAR
jgi:hypothetical protein